RRVQRKPSDETEEGKHELGRPLAGADTCDIGVTERRPSEFASPASSVRTTRIRRAAAAAATDNAVRAATAAAANDGAVQVRQRATAAANAKPSATAAPGRRHPP